MQINKANNKYLILFLLALVFLCPGIAALVFYTHPQWLSAAHTNKGQLLQPAQRLHFMDAGKWRLILWNPGDCDEHCQSSLQKLAKIRLSLGRRLYLVDEYLVFSNASETLPATLYRQLLNEDIQVRFLEDTQKKAQPLFGSEPAIFIASPDNFLVMAYTESADSADIFYDLDRLLQASGVKTNA